MEIKLPMCAKCKHQVSSLIQDCTGKYFVECHGKIEVFNVPNVNQFSNIKETEECIKMIVAFEELQ